MSERCQHGTVAHRQATTRRTSAADLSRTGARAWSRRKLSAARKWISASFQKARPGWVSQLLKHRRRHQLDIHHQKRQLGYWAMASARRRTFRRLLLDGLEQRRLLAVDLGDVTVYDIHEDIPVVGDYRQAAGKLVFAGGTADTGGEVQLFDPTSGTTTTVDVNPGVAGSNPKNVTTIGNHVFFEAYDRNVGYEPRWFDASQSNPTVHTIDVHAGSADSTSGFTKANDSFVLIGDKLYFSASDATHGFELRWIDITETNPTIHTLDINSGAAGSRVGNLGGFASVGNKLYFSAEDPTHGVELRWIDTGSAPSTVHTVDIRSGTRDSNAGRYGGFEVVGNKLYFSADGPLGYELRWIDTSLATPVIHTVDVYQGGNSNAGRYGGFLAVGDKLYFDAFDLLDGHELRWIDVNEASPTIHSLDIYSGQSNSEPGERGGFAWANNKLFFWAVDATFGGEMRWIDTTTNTPTLNTFNIAIGGGFSFAGRYGLVVANNKLFFSSDELHWVDTALAAPVLHTIDIFPGNASTMSSNPGEHGGFVALGDRVFFTAKDGTVGAELRWVDSTLTTPVVNTLDILGGSSSSDPGQTGWAVAGSKLYFTAFDTTDGIELHWLDTQSSTPTVQTIDVYDGISSRAGRYGGLQIVGEKLFFAAVDPDVGNELRWIDTTSPNPVVNTIDIFSGPGYAEPGRYGGFAVVGSKLYFTADDLAHGNELRWIDTEDPALTVHTLDFNSGNSPSLPGRYGGFTVVGDKLFFNAFESATGWELRWIDTKVDTPTVHTVDVYSGSMSSLAGKLGGYASIGNRLFFVATDPVHGSELRWIDTTSATPTVQTLDINVGTASSIGDDEGVYGGHLTPVGDKLFFAAADASGGDELRWIDATAVTPTLNTIEIYAGVGSASPGRYGGLTTVGDNLFFSARDQIHGVELRWLDTTLSTPGVNTVEVLSGSGSSFAGIYGFLPAVGESLFFTAYDSESGYELRWIETSQASPMVNTLDLYSGQSGSNAGEFGGFVAIGNQLFFSAESFGLGTELFSLDLQELEPTLTVTISQDSISEAGGSSQVDVTRNRDLDQELIVTLMTDDPSEASVPATVTIPAGNASVSFTISGVDDTIVDGTQAVTLTASAEGYGDGQDQVDVTDDDVPSLTLTLEESAISESGGTSQATLTRNTDTTSAQVVNLISNDPSEASVPASVTIPAGSASVTFTVQAVDDAIVDGTQSVTITATASGHTAGSDAIEVTDDDTPELTLAINQASIGENGGMSQAVLSRNTETDSALVVTLFSNDLSEATVPTSVTIPAGNASLVFTISGVDDLVVDGTQTVTITASATGFSSGSDTIDITDDDTPEVTLVIDEDSISENNGTSSATVSRNTDTSAELTVSLTSSDLSELSVPASVTIPAGSTFVTFDIDGVDDALIDGSQNVTVTAAAAAHASASDTVEVTDDDVPLLTLVIDESSISENGGTSLATVSRNTETTAALFVTLVSRDATEIQVPPVVVIPAGSHSATFALRAVDDLLVDGTQGVTVAAVAPGHAEGSDAIDVTDDDVPQLTIVVEDASIQEIGGTTQATVSRNTDPTSALSVTLISNDVGEATIPASVTIPVGSASVTLTINAVHDAIVDGTQTVTLEASATGYAGGSDTVDVVDGDTPELTLEIDELTISENGGVSQATVSRNTDTASDLVVSLASLDSTEATAPASVTIPAGSVSATFVVQGVDDALQDGVQTVVVTATATGHADGSDSIDVTDDDSPELLLELELSSISENGGVSNATVSRNTDTTSELVITLISSDPGEASVPSSVTIPAGGASATFVVQGVDDAIVDGAQSVVITASTNGHADGRDALDVEDDDTPQLTLVLDETSIGENGGSAQATVSRNTETTSELVVTLNSSDFGEATLPPTVTIPAGSASVVFTVDGVDDALVDGAQTVTVTATAASHAQGSATLEVTDDDTPQLTLVLDETSIGESGGAAQATVSRNTETTSELVVTLNSSDFGEATLPPTVTIPAGSASVVFTVDGVDDALVDGAQTVTVTATAASHAQGSATLEVTDDDTPQLTLVLDEASIGENGGVAQATVSRNTETTSELVVRLMSSDTSEASLPSTVTIPAGSASVAFTIDGVDDALVDGTQTVTFTASVSGYAQGSATLEVTDDDTPQLTLVLDEASIGENGGSAQATVSRNTETTSELVVRLMSSDTGEASLPSTVTIPAGSASVVFTVAGVDDALVDGTQTVTVTASASGYAHGSATLEVTDDDTPQLALVLDEASIGENGGVAQATVSRNTENTSELVVRLMSSDMGEASLPSMVTIPAGSASVAFTIDGVDDALVDGTQTVTVTASASGYAHGSVTLEVTDDDTPQLTLVLDEASIGESGGAAQATVSRNTETTSELVVTLNSSDFGEASLPSTVTIPAGSASVAFTIDGVDDGLVDGVQTVTFTASVSGYAHGSATLEVTDDDTPQLTLVLDEASIGENGGVAQATVSRNTETTSELVVRLMSSDMGEASLPSMVTIPAGSASVAFTIDGVDDGLVDGVQTVTFTASASGYAQGSATLEVTDDDTPQLTLVLDEASIAENEGSAQATVSRNTETTSELVVTLNSSDFGEAAVPPTVTIPAGSASVAFTVAGVDDALVDGTQLVTITASAAGHASGSGTTDVTDNDVPELALVIEESSISENGGTSQATVSRNTDATSDLVVMLMPSDASKVTIPASVTIPAGSMSVSFAITAVDNLLVDGDLPLQVSASASGHESASDDVLLLEDDLWTWTNPNDPFDVNDDGFVTPIDALLVINFLNQSSASQLPPLTEKPEFFYDVSNDGFATSIDALMVINKLNSSGEGEPHRVSVGPPLYDTQLENERRKRLATDAFFEEFR